MNQRLKELMLEAGYAAPEIAGRANKFAELMVEECCKRLSEETILHDGYGYNQHELYNRLRKHFGVNK
jgi:hypothetical protein